MFSWLVPLLLLVLPRVGNRPRPGWCGCGPGSVDAPCWRGWMRRGSSLVASCCWATRDGASRAGRAIIGRRRQGSNQQANAAASKSPRVLARVLSAVAGCLPRRCPRPTHRRLSSVVCLPVRLSIRPYLAYPPSQGSKQLRSRGCGQTGGRGCGSGGMDGWTTDRGIGGASNRMGESSRWAGPPESGPAWWGSNTLNTPTHQKKRSKPRQRRQRE